MHVRAHARTLPPAQLQKRCLCLANTSLPDRQHCIAEFPEKAALQNIEDGTTPKDRTLAPGWRLFALQVGTEASSCMCPTH